MNYSDSINLITTENSIHGQYFFGWTGFPLMIDKEWIVHHEQVVSLAKCARQTIENIQQGIINAGYEQ